MEVLVGTDEIVPIEHQPGGSVRLIARSTILFLSAEGDYVRIHAESGRYLVRGSLGEFEQRWEPYGFVRTHRSFVVNMTRAVEIKPENHGSGMITLDDGSVAPIARRHAADLRRRLQLN